MRLFVAMDISDETKDYVYDLQKKINNPKLAKVKWIFKKSLHVTLKFLGEVPEEKLGDIKKALKDIKFEKFKLKTTELGFFPDDRNPKVIWLGLDPEIKIIELQQKIDEALLTVFPTNQEFKAHLTLGRVKLVKNRADFIARLKDIKTEKISFEVTGFRLMQSKLKKEGSVHSTIEEF
ncbi:MAG: RNA 2',3'-cyclic phosphodiesterase, partial [Nanoarchaeota archaeon]|nr:RNA 2',3'-cyclic phosphodiesterase [Nanoarchaeota archaeon]MBU4351704.1 RNA 2',3'-cyclic phosphodiesterase [Nanoarchaeota archaeon]MBU4456691.1 RNA 2',3'-cyclic phosphodiesterase [Nanoarchaeota archaeon]